MLKIDSSLSVRLTNLTFVCTVLILLMHLPVSGYNPWFLSHGLGPYTHLAVPLFFGISGFLLAKHCNEENWYPKVLKKRFFTLVIPYFAICTLYIIPIIIRQNLLHMGNWPDGAVRFDWYAVKRIYGLTPSFHPACGPFWYIRCLVFFILLSPLFAVIMRTSRKVAIAWLVVVSVGVSGIVASPFGREHSDFFYSFFCLRGLVTFCFGMFIAFWGVALKNSHRWALVVTCVILGELSRVVSVGVPFWDNLLSLVSYLSLAFALAAAMPAYSLPRCLTASSFAMFALHTMVYMAIAIVAGKIGVRDGFFYELMSLMPLVIVWAVSIAFVFVVKRYVPYGAQMFLGGR